MKAFYIIAQCMWGLPQTLLGLLVFLLHLRDAHFLYHGAVITRWSGASSVSLGLFVFVSASPVFSHPPENAPPQEQLAQRLLVHEYGHTIQSLILGPLYLIVIGIPSTLWEFLPYYHNKRQAEGRSYFSFFTEKWADRLGEAVTGATVL